MKNRIKCRGLRADTKEWAVGYYVELFSSSDDFATARAIPSILVPTEPIDLVELRDYEGIVHHYEVSPESVGQTSQRVDKNGKEIFEHDIVLINHRNGVVVYKDGFMCIEYKKHAYDKEMSYHSFGWYKSEHLEVIGNIIEHPERLTYEVLDKSNR